MTSFIRTERLSSGSERADTSCSQTRGAADSGAADFFSFEQLRTRSGGLERPRSAQDTQQEGPFNDLTIFYDINCFSRT